MKNRQIKNACAINTDDFYTQKIEQYMQLKYSTLRERGQNERKINSRANR